ncbi:MULTISPECIES: MinD/ParA family ATP-binding protein [Variovorax]|jgi:flagellar biosynthesis protein FlhG|uniref:MinD/ParA family ATP-binding protein n=1 Tax=Variovorax TaxID=34072 RepID=UPI00086D8A6E|nr:MULTISPECIES: flagellar biosynthesis protein FlhG [Variovorax]MBN8757132.1 flagellar biosynthesis protein FlhG [Variovorax sp.]ODU17907.1 MAG: flagellar biosynthesis protein FlhG [Variovorax sp. SCN 67-85]ODV24442.1 MAG: flagellar biosynthesis protein FlhG [Variovorax sp. SCN 67-20]OJZ13618.1 MAG: flagellar biosynthesis protein FlhG [Variovorax sp. 67-131]UKI06275.1 flagellar biosynthesis protein FlhG [Variovorax paradoxus]
MSKMVADQADGLRRLLAQTQTRVVAVASMGSGAGATTAAMNLGAALVQQGKNVLLLDEHCPKVGSACEVWAIDPLGNLADVAAGRLTLEGAAVRAGSGVHVLPAPPGVADDVTDPRSMWRDGVVIVDAALDSEGRLSPLAQGADELLLVLQPQPASITTAYAGIKRLHYAHGLKQLRFLVNGVAEVEAARQVMSNLANAGSRYLALSLEAAGWARFDARIADAWRLKQTIVEAFPASAAAVDFRRVADDMGRWPWRADARVAVTGNPAPAVMHTAAA